MGIAAAFQTPNWPLFAAFAVLLCITGYGLVRLSHRTRARIEKKVPKHAR
jgi:hypothetical protein